MSKSQKTRIEFEYGGKHYTLEYTANSLKKLERMGVKFSKLDEMVFSAPEVLFRGAFLARHPSETEAKIHEIYQALKRTAEDEEVEYDDEGNEVDALQNALAEMLAEAVEELSGRGGNASWKVTK